MKTLTPRGFLFPAPAFDALSGRQVLSSSETNSIPAPSRIGSQQHSGSTHRHDLRVLPQLPQKPESTARLSTHPCRTDAFPSNSTKQMFRTAEKALKHRKHWPFHDFSPCIIGQACPPDLNSRADNARKVAVDRPQLLDMTMSFRPSLFLSPLFSSSPVQPAQNAISAFLSPPPNQTTFF